MFFFLSACVRNRRWYQHSIYIMAEFQKWSKDDNIDFQGIQGIVKISKNRVYITDKILIIFILLITRKIILFFHTRVLYLFYLI